MNLNSVFNDEDLYAKHVFSLFRLKNGKYELDGESLEKFIMYLGIGERKLITYCKTCKKEFSFDVRTRVGYNLMQAHPQTNSITITSDTLGRINGELNLIIGYISGDEPPYDKEFLPEYNKWYIEFQFTCNNDSSHRYIMIVSIEQNYGDFIVRKIGQDPSILDVHGFDFEKYKVFLNSINAYSDYKKADLSFAEHFYVGAFAYLRRVFEKMVNKYLEGISITDNHMDKKIEAIQDKFDSRIRGLLKNLYGILSVSIHELDEDESKEYYEYLKAIIDIQLEYEKTEKDKENQALRLQSTISKIASGIKMRNKSE